MDNARKNCSKIGIAAWFIALFICVSSGSAVSDGVMPKMPGPPSSSVYWQLVRIDQTPDVTPHSGYKVNYEVQGLSLDLEDGLMAESLLEADASYQPEVTFSVSKDGPIIEHIYTWAPLPVYLESDGLYPITVQGRSNLSHTRINSRLSPYVHDNAQGRISAGLYNNYPDSLSFTFSTNDLLKDGRVIVSFIIRDVHEMFKLRIDYTYEMQNGIKPKPTPVPGFSSVELSKGGAPAYYDAVPGMDGLWQVTTAPEEYRAYGSMNGGEPRFYPADHEGNVVMNAAPADLTDDFISFVQGFVPTTPKELPRHYHETSPGVYSFTSRDGQVITRMHGRVDGALDAFYPMVGDPAVVSTIEGPIDPEQDYIDYIEGFGATVPSVAFPHYQLINNIYTFTGRDGVTRYRVFGRLNGAEPTYYEATEDGTILQHTPIDPQEDFDVYVKGFDATEPNAVPKYYQQVADGLYSVLDRDGTPLYRIYGVLDGEAPAFYPADASGNRIEGQSTISPEDDFDTYIAGFEPMQPSDVPQFYEETDVAQVWAFQDVDGQMQYRAYGSLNRNEPAFYPCDAEGNVAVSALPIQPASDLLMLPPPPVFSTATPENLPSFYIPVPNQQGVYTFMDQDGNTVYRVFGGYDDQEPAFYPSNPSGILLDNAEPINVEEDQIILAKPSATPIVFVVITQDPRAIPQNQINRNFISQPSATPFVRSVTPSASASESLPPVLRTVTAPPSSLFASYAYTVAPFPTLAPALTATMGQAFITPSPTPYAFEIIPHASSAPSEDPVLVRVYTSPPASTSYAASVYTAPATMAPVGEAVRQTMKNGALQTVLSVTQIPAPATMTPVGEPVRQTMISDAPQTVSSVTQIPVDTSSTVAPIVTAVIEPANETASTVKSVVLGTSSPTNAESAVPVTVTVPVDVTITPPATQENSAVLQTEAPSQAVPSEVPSEAPSEAPSEPMMPSETKASPESELQSDTVTPSEADMSSESETPSELESSIPIDSTEQKTGNALMIGSALAILLVIGAAVLMRRRKK